MAFVATKLRHFRIGSYKAKLYSFTNGASDGGGHFNTGLQSVEGALETTETSESTTCNMVERDTDNSGDQRGWVKMTTEDDEDGHILVFGHG